MNIDYTKAALLEVDIQNDFCPAYTGKNGRKHPAGTLAVDRADEVIGPLNSLAKKIRQKGGKVLATQDWHPADHVSFADSHPGKKPGDSINLPVPVIQQMLWPVHCRQDTEGAAFHEDLDTTLIDAVFRKGRQKNIDSYSAFFENDSCTPTDLYDYLKEQGIDTLLIGGLATDYCVFYTVTDSLRLGFNTWCIIDACAGIDLPAGSLDKAVVAMKEQGAIFASASDF